MAAPMESAVQLALSAGLTLGIPLLIAVFEWRASRRKGRDDDDGRRPPHVPAPRPLCGTERRLPPCLIPTDQWRAPIRTRERELA